jgi:tryptophan synthase alpha chain
MTHTKTLNGIEAIAAMFARAKDQARAAFLPYFPIGYPDYETSLDTIQQMAEIGADGFEIGVPFSDPIADGPVIQAATQIALNNGITLRKCIEAVRALRARGVHQPMLMMSYLNPLLAYGFEPFVQDAKAAGADGFIVPDLPPEEAGKFSEICQREGLALVFFTAPTSNHQRIDLAAESATGFIYVVSLTGVTGARRELPPDLLDYIARLRERTEKPLVLGFGISTPEHARMLNGLVEGFIVASALIKTSEKGVAAVREHAASLRAALNT